MALTKEQINIKNKIREHVALLPFYVQEYIEDQDENGMSINTQLIYLYHFESFFKWLIADSIVDVPDIKDIPLQALDSLKKPVVKTYFDKLKNENINENKKEKSYRTRKDTTLNTPKSALRSLFNYLANQTEDRDGNCYIERNVMAKFPLKKVKVSRTARADAINKVILKDEQLANFIPFLRNDYERLVVENKRLLNQFKKNKERDIAICHLFIGSGIRVGELSSIEIKNIDFENSLILINRKGNELSSVPVLIDAMLDVQKYLAVRNARYPGAEDVPFLFVTNKGQVKEISRRTVQTLVEKYTKAYLGRDGILPHKLRHSFALEYMKSNGNNLQLLSEQLGHHNLNTTGLYVNMSDNERLEAMERFGQALNKEEDE